MKMKRKDLEEVNDDFSDFSLSSPARKIRRLDAELSPIMEEEDPRIPLDFEQQAVPKSKLTSYMEQGGGSGPVIEELPSVSENEERALVLFKPINTPLLLSPSNFYLTVNSDVMSGIKNQFLWTTQSNVGNSAEDEEARRGSNDRASTEERLAVVPWVPSQIPHAEVSELMESEDTMEIEENNVAAVPEQGSEFSEMVSEGLLHQWQQQQQHCMIPQIPQNASTPIVWFR